MLQQGYITAENGDSAGLTAAVVSSWRQQRGDSSSRPSSGCCWRRPLRIAAQAAPGFQLNLRHPPAAVIHPRWLTGYQLNIKVIGLLYLQRSGSFRGAQYIAGGKC